MMTKRLALVGVMTLAMLAACSKQAPPPPADDEAESPARVETPPPPPKMSREDMTKSLLELIDTAPQCQQFRTQLEEGSKAPPEQVSTDDLNKMVAQAYAAGCGKKR
jgi:hypothetical protein